MDLENELKDIKKMITQIYFTIIQKPTEPTAEEVVAFRESMEQSCLEHNSKNAVNKIYE